MFGIILHLTNSYLNVPWGGGQHIADSSSNYTLGESWYWLVEDSFIPYC